jgi:F-type H+-transporting ATPase subunit gamma
VNQRLRNEDVDSPLAIIRTVKAVTVCLVTGDRGLCGGYNNFAIKKVRPTPSGPYMLQSQ